MKYQNNKKAISPLIATVLVIGFTIVLAGVVMQFLIPLFTSSTEQSKADAALMNKCGQFSTALTIKEAKLVGDDLKIIVDNPTPAKIQYLIVKYYDDAGNAGACKLTKGDDKADNAVIAGGGIVSMTVGPVSAPVNLKDIEGSEDCVLDTATVTGTINKVEVTPAVFMDATKETKPCGSAVVSATVY